MAFDKNKPADNGVVSEGPQEIRDNLELLSTMFDSHEGSSLFEGTIRFDATACKFLRYNGLDWDDKLISVAGGGTGIGSYTTGDILYASGTDTLSKLAGVATGYSLLSGTAPSWGKIGLTTHVSGTLPIANGGTNKISFTAGYVHYGNFDTSSALSFNSGTGTLSATAFSGNGSALTNINASNISSGTISIDRLPHGALERLYVTDDMTTLLELDINDVQNGDTVKVTDPGTMYYVKDETQLGTLGAFEVYTAGAATSVPWSGVTSTPTTISGYGITDAVTTSGNQTIGGTKEFSSTITGSISGTAAVATTVTCADESTDTTCNVAFVTAATGNLGIKTGTNLTFNSATGVLTASGFSGPLTGNVTGDCSGTAAIATSITLVATNSTDATHYPVFTDAATGNENPRTDTGFTYNPSTGVLTATSFAGTVTTAAQPNITSLGRLISLAVDDINIYGTVIQCTSDADLTLTAPAVGRGVVIEGVKVVGGVVTGISSLTATTMVGNVTGNVSGSSGSCTGNAATANALSGVGFVESSGTYGSGTDIALSGSGTRMIWNPKKAAFRAGYVNSTQWDNANVGKYSVAMGYDTKASDQNSTAMGDNTTASGSGSTAMGNRTTASGEVSTAMGYYTTASGSTSTAMGYRTTASGEVSTAMGYYTTASGHTSTAMGYYTTASGQISTAMGYSTKAESFASVAIGQYNVGGGTPGSWVPADPIFEIGNGASGSLSNSTTIYKNGNINTIGTITAAGFSGPLAGAGSIELTGAFGYGTDIALSGAGTRMIWNPKKAAFRAGYVNSTQWNNANVGIYSVAMGASTTASGNYSTAMGHLTEATGFISTAMGYQTTASGGYSTAMGRSATASGSSSTAMGRSATASGNYSTAMGFYTKAEAQLCFAIGQYNVGGGNSASWVATDPLFEIGIGTGDSTRANALTVLKNGNTGLGISNPSYQLQLSTDSAAKPTTTTWTTTSDIRTKKDIVNADLTRCYDIVKNLRLVHHGWADGLFSDAVTEDKTQLGWIAQEAETFFPKAVHTKKITFHEGIHTGEYEDYESPVMEEIDGIMLPILDEQGNPVTETKTREIIVTTEIEDGKHLDSDQIIKALYGAVQYLISKVEVLEGLQE